MNFIKEVKKNSSYIYNQFKDKNTKYNTYINNSKNQVITTLDNKHNEKVNEFINNDYILKKKKKLYNCLIIELNDINNLKSNMITYDILKKKTELKNNIENLNIEINILSNKHNEIDYYENTLNILLDYYNENINTNDNIININDKSKLYNKYMKIVYNININKNKKMYHIKNCSNCNIEKILHINDSYIVCKICGDAELILLENEKCNYKDNYSENKVCTYKRINHLSEILNQLQAKETTDISKEIYDKIKNELTIQRIYDYSKIDCKKIKNILKKLKLNKYYEHTQHILYTLTGIPAPTITREQEENIKKIFKNLFLFINQNIEKVF